MKLAILDDSNGTRTSYKRGAILDYCDKFGYDRTRIIEVEKWEELHDSDGNLITKEEYKGKDFIFHCEDGPAYYVLDSYGGKNIKKWVCEEYYILGEKHRYDGPAYREYLVDKEDDNFSDWYIRGCRIDGTKYKAWLIENDMDINNLTDNDKILIDVKWCHR